MPPSVTFLPFLLLARGPSGWANCLSKSLSSGSDPRLTSKKRNVGLHEISGESSRCAQKILKLAAALRNRSTHISTASRNLRMSLLSAVIAIMSGTGASLTFSPCALVTSRWPEPRPLILIFAAVFWYSVIVFMPPKPIKNGTKSNSGCVGGSSSCAQMRDACFGQPLPFSSARAEDEAAEDEAPADDA